MNKNHPGFVNVAKGIAKRQGISVMRADRELASRTRKDTTAAKRKNPRLKRVKG